MTQQEKIDLIVKLRDSGKTWWDISQEVGNISVEMCRYRYKQTKGLLKSKNDGMDLRDYFAAKAMVALTQKKYPHEILEEEYTKDIYKAAYKMADAMMKEREKK